MPTSHRRIPVIEDAALSAAIDGARASLGASRSKAAVLRELALRGWREIEDQDRRQRDAADALIALMDEGAFDWAALEELRSIDTEPR
jgi:hypothetical protein